MCYNPDNLYIHLHRLTVYKGKMNGAYERPEKYVPKNKTIKINKLYK